MNTAHFIADVPGSREVSNLEPYQTSQTYFCVEIAVQCATGDRGIDIEFLARAEVPNSRLTGFSTRNGKDVSVGLLIAQELPKLAKRSRWNIYTAIQVPLLGDNQITDVGETDPVEFDAELNQDLAFELREATSRHRETAMQFNDAKKYLEDNINRLSGDPSRAKSHALFIAECMKKSGSPFLSSYNTTKAATLVSSVDELITRKSARHPNFQRHLDEILRILSSASLGKLWRSTPPSA